MAVNMSDMELDELRPPGVLPDTQFLADRLGDLGALLEALIDATRGTEKPAPKLIAVNPGAVFVSSTRFRVTALITSGGTGDVMRLNIGVAGEFEWLNVTGGLTSIPFRYIVDAGIDISCVDVTNPANILWRTYLLGFPEVS